MFLYRNAKKIVVSHAFSDDFESLKAVSDATLGVVEMSSGVAVLGHSLSTDPSGKVVAIFDRDNLPIGKYKFTWESEEANAFDVEEYSVVGYPYFNLRDLRAKESASFVKDDEVLVKTRDLVEARLESLIGRAFRPSRFKELILVGSCIAETWQYDLREVLSAQLNGSATEYAITPGGNIEVPGAKPGDLLTVDYIYGTEMNPDIERACLLLAEEILKNMPSNVTSRTLDSGIFERFVVGGVGSAQTSIPEVNEIIERYRRRF